MNNVYRRASRRISYSRKYKSRDEINSNANVWLKFGESRVSVVSRRESVFARIKVSHERQFSSLKAALTAIRINYNVIKLPPMICYDDARVIYVPSHLSGTAAAGAPRKVQKRSPVELSSFRVFRIFRVCVKTQQGRTSPSPGPRFSRHLDSDGKRVRLSPRARARDPTIESCGYRVINSRREMRRMLAYPLDGFRLSAAFTLPGQRNSVSRFASRVMCWIIS